MSTIILNTISRIFAFFKVPYNVEQDYDYYETFVFDIRPSSDREKKYLIKSIKYFLLYNNCLDLGSRKVACIKFFRQKAVERFFLFNPHLENNGNNYRVSLKDALIFLQVHTSLWNEEKKEVVKCQ